MRFLVIILISLTVFLFSCTTTSTNDEVAVGADSDIYYVAERVNELCFNSKSPQFLTELSSFRPDAGNSGVDFQLEGVWKNDYKTLNMQVIGEFGEQYAYFELNEHEIKVFSSRKNILESPEVKNLIQFISSLGAHELRQMFCGSYAFHPTEKNILMKGDDFLVDNKQEIDGHNFDVQSNLNLEDSPSNSNEDGYDLTIQSKFLYGFWGGDSQLNLNWSGFVDDEKVIPKTINFNYEKNQYELSVLDYN